MQLSGSNPLDGLRAFLFLGRPGYGFVLSKIIRRNPAPAQEMMCLVAILAGLAPSWEDRTLRKEGTGREEGKRYDRKTAAARREPGRSMRAQHHQATSNRSIGKQSWGVESGSTGARASRSARTQLSPVPGGRISDSQS